MAMEERELARQALEAKTIDGSATASGDDMQDYLADLGERFRLKSLEQRASSGGG